MKAVGVHIRPVEAADNEILARIIYNILDELEVPEKGSTYEDEALQHMYESFAVPRAYYFVAEMDGRVIGGGGIMPLKKESPDTCELQKMYLLRETRGRGIGARLLQTCLQIAVEFEYKYCYLETMNNMKSAQQLYLKAGFNFLEKRLGDTGHCACPIWMMRKL